MTSLVELVDNSRTDKNTGHSYLPTYEEILFPMKHTAKNVIEIGIGPFKDIHHYPGLPGNGGSIKLWADYFKNAIVYATDIITYENVYDGIKDNDRIKIYAATNAYDAKFVQDTFIAQGIKFDMILDDGPHTLESMKQCIHLYLPLLTENGVLIIEDVQSIDWFEELTAEVPTELLSHVKTYDLRHIKNRYDDLIFTIDKTSAL
jgi:hypothetical protein